ncbi:MAG: tRNA (adenosine(37)-N6)-threonylcarbamoyltransferase complex ATPase subunit type 1 TsaE [Candidatus Saccharimonadales bacterium]|jgi:tRNA threonylcarbamoyladenosine biosynthesis protein TsaE
MADTQSQIVSGSPARTELIAIAIGKRLRGGEVIDLIGDLGSGKTTFVRGLAKGLGSSAPVSSPTFKINNVYTGGKLRLYHFDFYRLAESGILASELAEILTEPDCAIVIEWSDIVRTQLPKKQLTITFTQTADKTRQLIFSYPKSLDYMVKGIL